MEFASELDSNVNLRQLEVDPGAFMNDGHETHLIFSDNKSPYLDIEGEQHRVSSTGVDFVPSHSLTQDDACMNLETEQCLDDCDDYLHQKSEIMYETVRNTGIMSELFADSEDYLNMQNEDEEDSELQNTKMCSELSFDDISHCLSDITSEHMGHLLSFPDSPTLNPDAIDEKLSFSSCLDDPEEEFLREERDEEALLLAEVEKAEKLGGVLECQIGEGSKGSEIAREAKDEREQGSNKGSGRSNGKKAKVDWTPELHRRFVQAVEQLGLDKAIPSKVLELMGVKCLTRHNISSHLQKYRSHKKQHMGLREVESTNNNQHWRWSEATRNNFVRIQAPTLARPTTLLPELHVWGHPCWPSSLACVLDAWGRPFSYPPQPILRLPLAPLPTHSNRIIPEKHQQQIPKETVVAAINEVLRNPYIPLPIGLKPPPLESVISELQHQGVSIRG